jgi:hypothetical protein
MHVTSYTLRRDIFLPILKYTTTLAILEQARVLALARLDNLAGEIICGRYT